MSWEPVDRWPPVYDADDLRAVIAAIARPESSVAASIYGSTTIGASHCQGDVLHIDSDFACIDATGRPAKVTRDHGKYWMLLGNTCDFSRTGPMEQYTQIIPIDSFGWAALDRSLWDRLRRYDTSRRFFIPPWPGSAESANHTFVADFARPVSAHKDGIRSSATLVARLSRAGWILLNACLLRFLARDDGRFDPD